MIAEELVQKYIRGELNINVDKLSVEDKVKYLQLIQFTDLLFKAINSKLCYDELVKRLRYAESIETEESE